MNAMLGHHALRTMCSAARIQHSTCVWRVRHAPCILLCLPAVRQASCPSFTRVTITDLKEEVMEQIANKEAAESVCKDLAHLYHYYLHGPEVSWDPPLRTWSHPTMGTPCRV